MKQRSSLNDRQAKASAPTRGRDGSKRRNRLFELKELQSVGRAFSYEPKAGGCETKSSKTRGAVPFRHSFNVLNLFTQFLNVHLDLKG